MPITPVPIYRGPTSFDKGLQIRIFFSGAVYAGIPWLAMSLVDPPGFWFLLPLIYLFTWLVIPFFVSLSSPLGHFMGAKVGKWVVLSGILWHGILLGLITLYKWGGYHQRPLYTGLLALLTLPLALIAARFAGSVGGYTPPETETSETSSGKPRSRQS